MEDLSRGRIQINSDKAKDINDIHIVQVKLQVRSNMRLMIENHENIPSSESHLISKAVLSTIPSSLRGISNYQRKFQTSSREWLKRHNRILH